MSPQNSNLQTRIHLFAYSSTICLLILLWQMGFVSRTLTNQKSSLIDIQALDQKDKELLDYVRGHFIYLPSVLKYNFGKNFTLPDLDPEVDDLIRTIFNNKTEGFFVEVGAHDGLTFSHTLVLELKLNWTGLLIECNPELVPTLESINRKTFISNVCLSSTSHPVKARMTSVDKWLASSSLGSGDAFPRTYSNLTTYEVQTIPLYSVIASIDVTDVDLVILDVQSLELDVLKHFPFDLIHVKVWVVEVYFYSQVQKNWLTNFMAKNGYPENRVQILTNDFVFLHNSFVEWK